MLVKTRAIVISAIRYQEKSLIVKCFTRDFGLRSYFVHSAFSAKSSHKIAYFQPMTILEIEAVHKNKGTLETFREVKLGSALPSISTDIVKSTIAMFASEMLHYSIREEEANPGLFSYLETALHWLDTHDNITNFHLILFLEVTKFLGFYPDITETANPFFEINEGIFINHQAKSCLSAEETSLLRQLIKLRFDSDKKMFTASERQSLLKFLLSYYESHLEGFRKPNSVEVLREVFR